MFGESAAVAGGTVVVGAPGDDHAGGTNAGAAYVYSSSTTAFDALDVEKAEITLGPDEDDDTFEVKGTLALRDSSDGIDPSTEDVAITVGTFSTTIPAGSFTAVDGDGRYGFSSATLQVVLEAVDDGVFEYELEATGVDLSGTTNPVTIALTVGDDSGATETEAEFR